MRIVYSHIFLITHLWKITAIIWFILHLVKPIIELLHICYGIFDLFKFQLFHKQTLQLFLDWRIVRIRVRWWFWYSSQNKDKLMKKHIWLISHWDISVIFCSWFLVKLDELIIVKVQIFILSNWGNGCSEIILKRLNVKGVRNEKIVSTKLQKCSNLDFQILVLNFFPSNDCLSFFKVLIDVVLKHSFELILIS